MKQQEQLAGFWDNVQPGVKKGVLIAIGGVAASTAAYFVYKSYKKNKADKILMRAGIDGTLASIVEKINMAISGLGTDMEKIYEAYADIPTQQDFFTVSKLYDEAYDETLNDALHNDYVSEEEMQTLKNIIALKPKNKFGKPSYHLLNSWIDRLSRAKGTFNTDEDAIYRVLWEVPDWYGLKLLSAAINTNKNQTGYSSLTDYLKGELDSGSEQNHAADIMGRKKAYANEKSANSK